MAEDQGALSPKAKFSPKAKYLAGAGIALGALGAAFLLFRKWEEHKAEKAFKELMRKAVAGEIPKRLALEQILALGVTPDGKKVLKIAADPRLPCSTVFPPAVVAATPGMAEALVELRRNGTCL